MNAETNAPKIDKAVALDFGLGEMAVPTVVAAGRGAVARQILDLAFAHGVKVREDADLVEILATLDVGDEIPIVAFAAVAEILSHVYRWELHQREMDETR
jgi:flagellar biosynthesis protein